MILIMPYSFKVPTECMHYLYVFLQRMKIRSLARRVLVRFVSHCDNLRSMDSAAKLRFLLYCLGPLGEQIYEKYLNFIVYLIQIIKLP